MTGPDAGKGGRVAIVTGGASGIGRAGALRLASEGYALAVCDTDYPGAKLVAQQARERGVAAYAIETDVTDQAAVSRAVDGTVRRHGRLDLYWSNAGVSVHGGIEATDAEWARAWTVNTHSHVLAARAAIPHLLGGSGAFIVTASAAGLLSHVTAAPYAVSKHAAVALAQWLAISYRHTGLYVGCLCPKVVRTPMMAQATGKSAASATAARSYGQVLEPEQVADAVMQAMAQRRFLILPHDEVLGQFRAMAADIDGFILALSRIRDEAMKATVTDE